MAVDLDIHRASELERNEAYRNVHEVWSGGKSLEEHMRRRLVSVQHNRALWYVGCTGGRVVTSLGCYPLHFRIEGRIVSGMAIGAVHTVPEYRGRGYAPQLMEWAERDQRSAGTLLSLLYSDIAPDYYRRLGYTTCPCWEANIETTRAIEVARESKAPTKLSAISPFEERSAIIALYESHYSTFAISIRRDALYWDYLLAKDSDDEFFQLQDETGRIDGYVRLRTDDAHCAIRDFALKNPTDEWLGVLLAAVAGRASARGITNVGGGLPNQPAVRRIGTVVPRRREITMLKPLDPSLIVSENICDAAQHFLEIDHV